jgi:hypothetical protein
MRLRSPRVTLCALAAATALAGTAGSSLAGTTSEEVYGTVELLDETSVVVTAAPIFDVDEAAAEAEGAIVSREACSIGDRSGELRPITRFFDRDIASIQTTGQFVVTPNGNAHLICHVDADTNDPATDFLRATPSQAVVVEDAFCRLPNRRRATGSQIVLTPSGHITLICHFAPPTPSTGA